MPNTFQNIINSDTFNELIFPKTGSVPTETTYNDLRELNFQLSSILNNLTIQLNCPICQDIPTQPFILPNCGHSFCYSCLKHWFTNNPSCAICRKEIGDSKPILNVSLKNLVHSLFDDLFKSIKLLNVKNESHLIKLLSEWKTEKNEEFDADKLNNFVWLNKINETWARPIVDTEDGVPRCSACHWELIDGMCENCGRLMVNWQDRNDGDDLDVDNDTDENENVNHFRRELNSDDDDDDDDDDWGANNSRVQLTDDIAVESSGEQSDGELIPRFNNDVYESDDGFVVDDDEEEIDSESSEENQSNDSDGYTVESTNDSIGDILSGDDEIVGNYNKNANRKKTKRKNVHIISDTDDDFGNDDDDDENDENDVDARFQQSKFVKPNSKKRKHKRKHRHKKVKRDKN